MLKKLVMFSMVVTMSMPLGAIFVTFERKKDDTATYIICHSYFSTMRVGCLETAEKVIKVHPFALQTAKFTLDVNLEDEIKVFQNSGMSSRPVIDVAFYEEPENKDRFFIL